MDDLTRRRIKTALAVAAWFAQIAYVVMPFDLLPDFIPVIGWIDDAIALFGLMITTVGIVQTLRETDLPELLGVEPAPVLATEPYEPIPRDVLDSL